MNLFNHKQVHNNGVHNLPIMVEVNNKNFKKLFPKIEIAIKNASFISIDAEFSGIKDHKVPELS